MSQEKGTKRSDEFRTDEQTTGHVEDSDGSSDTIETGGDVRTTTRAAVVPVYAEEFSTWGRLVEDLLAADWDEIVICADVPDRKTRAALERFEDDPRVTLSVHNTRRGKGGALLDGLDATSADVIGYVDADGAVAVRELDCLFRLVESGDADVAIGSRGISGDRRMGQSIVRRAFAAGYGTLARLVTGVPVHDFQCGAKALSRDAWESVSDDLRERGFAFDTELVSRLYHRGFNVREVSINWYDPGDSDVRIGSDVPSMLGALGRIRRGPSGGSPEQKASGALRVAIVSCHPPNRGHLAEYTEELARAMGARDDVDLTVISRRDDDAPPVERRQNYVVRRIWRRDSLRGTVALLRELLTGEYDVVHFNIHMTYYGTKNAYRFIGLALPPLLSRVDDLTVVTTLHDLLEVVDDRFVEEEIGVVERLGAVFATQLVLLGDGTTVTSEEYLDIVTSRYQSANVYHVPHGTFETEVAGTGGDSTLRVLLFGHLGPTKDVETMVEVIERVQEHVPDAELWIAGDSHPGYPGYREALEKKYSRTPGVRFTGYVEEHEMDEVWHGATLVVMPYRTCTGVSGVFQLAKTYGKPVVAYDVDGMRTSTVETGGSATFVRPGDPNEMAARIVQLWADRDALDEMGSANAEASKEYTISHTADQLVEVFRACDPKDERGRMNGRDVLRRMNSERCPVPGCEGDLVRREYKDTDAVVCRTCETPAVRVWGDSG